MEQQTIKRVEKEPSDENVTSFVGMSLVERLSLRLGLWREWMKRLPRRQGHFDWLTIIMSAVGGLLSGARNMFSTEVVRQEKALRDLLGIKDAPEASRIRRLCRSLAPKTPRGLAPLAVTMCRE